MSSAEDNKPKFRGTWTPTVPDPVHEKPMYIPPKAHLAAIQSQKPKGFLASFAGKSEYVFQALILFAIYILAFSTRLFSVVRYESVIHEFDPWFNFRSTKYLVAEGFYEFNNWFDEKTWSPLGRYVGGTVYPGLMWTAGTVYHLLHLTHFPVDIRNVCVMLAPWMAGNTCIATYLLTKEVWNGSAGIFAAAFIAMAPGYISRSVAGSYDNEAIAIFALIFCFFLWVKAVKTGSMMWGAFAALGYFYMVAAWGGYIFIINLIPMHVFVLLVAGRYSERLYVAYCTFYPLATLLSMNVQFVQFQPVSSPEHLAAFGVFGLLQLYAFYYWFIARLHPTHVKVVLRWLFLFAVAVVGSVVVLAALGYLPFLTGRLKTLLGSTSSIAIIKSVSEHQPSPWTTFFFDLHCLVWLVPVGVYFCFVQLTDANTFCILYVLFSAYFAGIMVRLVLVLTPVCCVLGGVGASTTMQYFMEVLLRKEKKSTDAANATAKPTHTKTPSTASAASAGEGKADGEGKEKEGDTDSTSAASSATPASSEEENAGYLEHGYGYGLRSQPPVRASKLVALAVVVSMCVLFAFYTKHCIWVTSTAYSSPSIVLMANDGMGGKIIFDDFREAYTWLRHNTAPDARIMSWWDYGYQITGMGNKTTIVDNNTRNNTHIATVGLAMASNESRAWGIMKKLDVSYALVVFGGRIGYSSDDINKFLWMVRISSGVYPEIVETDYFNKHGQYRIDDTASPRMLNSIMYKMCYYRFGDSQTVYGRPSGYDRVRNSEIGRKGFKLTHLEEAFTSEHWMVRIYKVKDERELPPAIDYAVPL